MPKFQTNLLIRDKRVQAFAAQGATLNYRTLSDEEFDTEMRRKLVEEAQEAAASTPATLKKELADVFEVLIALGKNNGISSDDIRAQAQATFEKLGGFNNRIFSESIEAPEGHETTAYHRQHPQKYPEIS